MFHLKAMKKYFNFAFLSAIALAGTFGLTACSSSDDLAAETNPNYDPNTKEVTVDFVFNVETGAPSTTRMSSSAVQIGTGTFRGIKDAQLFTYKLSGGGQHVCLGTETADKTYDLNELIAAEALNGTGTDKSRRVLEMSLPTGTNTLMFWGRAMQGAVPTGKTAGAVYGAIDFAPNSTLANAAFSLTKCVPDDASATGKTALLQYEKLIAKVLNDIVNSSSTVNVTRGGKTVNKTLAWKDYVDFANNGTLTAKEKDPSTFVDADHCSDMSALGVILANAFVTLNTFKSSELRNGQGKIIAALVGDLNTLMNSVTEATPTTVEEEAAQAVAERVKTVITSYFNPSSTCTWKGTSEVVSNSGLSGLDKVTADLNKFPDGIFHLPPGSTVMKYTAVDNSGASTVIVNQYQYMSQVPTYAMGSSSGSFNPDNYMYPAELCYFGNSPIRVTSDSHKKAEYPDGAAEWDNDNNWKTSYTPGNNTVDWTKDGVVQSTTRSVAMQENINYGTAMLKTTIAYESGKTSLKDNNSHIHSGEADNTIAISSNPFTLTGVLIGGQPQTVGWNYIVKTIDPNPFICMVYDRDLSSSAIPTPAGSENYTMVWDNYTTDATQNTVYVALELTNNSGQDFWGMNNLIRNGSSFYLIGKLDPTQASNTITWPTAERPYALPPYNNDGTTKQTPRIFIQDYMTTANFIIGEESLKQALVSVPDLRASHLSLGLSVDLSWSNGLSFESVLGQD